MCIWLVGIPAPFLRYIVDVYCSFKINSKRFHPFVILDNPCLDIFYTGYCLSTYTTATHPIGIYALGMNTNLFSHLPSLSLIRYVWYHPSPSLIDILNEYTPILSPFILS